MKRKAIIVFFGLACLAIFLNATKILPGCDAPFVGGHTGAPGETACNGCHAGTLNSGPATFTFDIGTSSYSSGQTYTGTVRVSQSLIAKFGFSCLALKDSNNTTIGSFNVIDAVRTRTYTDGPRRYVSHTPCGADSANSNSWRFTWTAPLTNVGKIKLYVGLLAADHSHSTTGDFSYTASNELLFQPSIGLSEIKELPSTVKMFPNPASDQLNLDFSAIPELSEYEISIFNVDGKVVHSESTGLKKINVKLTGLSDGIYFVKIESKQLNIYRKIFICKSE